MKSKKKIIQIMAPAAPVFAVYNTSGKGEPLSKDGLFLRPCPALAPIEDEREERYVIGLCLESHGLDFPTAQNLCGYATSEEDAIAQYVCNDDEP